MVYDYLFISFLLEEIILKASPLFIWKLFDSDFPN